MKAFILLSLTLGILPPAMAQTTAPSVEEILPLRSCARSLARDISGTRFREGQSSQDENTFYFLNCNDNWDLGQDHYVYTPNGVYYFFIKSHKDYKGGFEGTQFRLNIEGNTYYFKTNIVGGMGHLFDANGKNLYLAENDPENLTIDPTTKNPVINYYMKTLTGKSDGKSAIVAEPATGERLLKAQACIQSKVMDLGGTLMRVYKARRDYRQVTPDVLTQYEAFVRELLQNPSCTYDPMIAGKFGTFLENIANREP